MPVCKSFVNNGSTFVKVWQIDESESDLKANLSLTKASLDRLNVMKSESHRKGFLAVRQLLKCFNYSDQDLYYNTDGKPFLKDGKHISISHSFVYAAIVISKVTVGVDIEKCRDKITRLASKFIDYEEHFLNENLNSEIERLTAIWTTKEALYKFYGKAGLSLKSECMVLPFSIESTSGVSWILDKDQKVKCYWTRSKIEDYFLTMCVNE